MPTTGAASSEGPAPERLTPEQQELAAKWLPLIDKVLSRYRVPYHLHADARADAQVALCRAAARWDPARGAKFYSFAFVAILREVRRTVQTAGRHTHAALPDERVDAAQDLAHDDAPDAGLVQADERRRLLAVIRHLPRPQARLLRLALAGETTTEIAARLGITLRATQSRLSEARQALRELLREGHTDGDDDERVVGHTDGPA